MSEIVEEQRRAAQNQSLFREVNERIQKVVGSSRMFATEIGSASAPTKPVRSTF